MPHVEGNIYTRENGLDEPHNMATVVDYSLFWIELGHSGACTLLAAVGSQLQPVFDKISALRCKC
jgi:hypothetical protein